MKKIIFGIWLVVIGWLFLSTSNFLITNNSYAQFNKRDTVSIQSGETDSFVFDLDDDKLAAIEFPSTFTGASVTISTAPHPDSTFKVVQYDGEDITITATDGQQCGAKPVEINQLQRYIKIISASAEAADRLLWIVKTSF